MYGRRHRAVVVHPRLTAMPSAITRRAAKSAPRTPSTKRRSRRFRRSSNILIDQGCPPDAIVENDSGNGGALLLRIDLPNVPASVTLVRRFLQALAQKFDDPTCHIDTSVGNPGRITRVPGSRNQKLATKERPNRLCHTLSAPENLEPAPLDFLNKIAGTAIAPQEEKPDPTIEFCGHPGRRAQRANRDVVRLLGREQGETHGAQPQ